MARSPALLQDACVRERRLELPSSSSVSHDPEPCPTSYLLQCERDGRDHWRLAHTVNGAIAIAIDWTRATASEKGENRCW